jgi:splicing suppressor protein 51
MAFLPPSSCSRLALRATPSLARLRPNHVWRRSIFQLFKKRKDDASKEKSKAPLLTQDNLFHPFSKSPFEAVRQRGEAIKQLATCPVCSSTHTQEDAHTPTHPKAVSFECPDCGFPTHCSEEHWQADEEHKKYCSRLREVNEDEHDLRSGREIWEFKLPGEELFSLEETRLLADV